MSYSKSLKTSIVFCLILLVSFAFVVAGQSKQAKTLNILWSQPYPAQVKAIKNLADEYQKQFGVHVKVETVTWENVIQKTSARVSTGNPPDLAYVISSQGWTFYQNGWIQPVTEVMDFLGRDNYFVSSPGYQKVEGEHWLVPVGTMPLKITYRKDLLEKKGLEEPKTWDDLLSVAKSLTEDTNNDGKTDRYGISFCGSRSYCLAAQFMSFVWSNGGHILDENGNVVFDSTATVEALNFVKKLAKYAPPGIVQYSWENCVDTYASGKAAMTIYSELRPIMVAQERNPSIAEASAVAPIPTKTPEQESHNRWTTLNWGVFADSKMSAEAKHFIEWFMQTPRLIDYYHDIATGTLSAPAEKPVLGSSRLWENPKYDKFEKVVKDYSNLSKGSIMPSMEHPGQLNPAISVFMNDMTITDAVQKVLFKGVTPKKAVETAAEKMREYLEEH